MAFVLTFLLLCASALSANEHMTIDQIMPGHKLLGITLHDSVEVPDLSQVSVEGYEIENAVFVQENDVNLPTLFSDKVIDLASHPEIRIVLFQPEHNLLVVESPSGFIWEAEKIICDTSFHGLAQKIIQVEELESFFGSALWRLSTVPASLLEMVVQCDISFISQPNLTFSLPDSQWTEIIKGRGFETSEIGPVEANLQVAMNNVFFNIRPLIKGRLRISQGAIESSSFQINGPYEVRARLHAQISKPGVFVYSGHIPFAISHSIPLGSGFSIQITHSAGLEISLESRDESFQTAIEINMNEELHSY